MRTFKEQHQLSKLPAIYLDLDETLVDWFGGANTALKKYGYPEWNHPSWSSYTEEEADNIRWAILNKVSNFWLNLKFTKDGKKLWEFLKPYKPNILSACSPYSKTAKTQKKEWVTKHLGLNNLNKIHLVSRSEKCNFATNKQGKPNILVDDYIKNCDEFQRAGGISILVTSSNDVIEKLKEFGFK